MCISEYFAPFNVSHYSVYTMETNSNKDYDEATFFYSSFFSSFNQLFVVYRYIAWLNFSGDYNNNDLDYEVLHSYINLLQ